MLEERVLLEVVALLEADRADRADERPLVRVRALVILERRVLRELLAADVARPVAQAGWRRRHSRSRRGGGRPLRQEDRQTRAGGAGGTPQEGLGRRQG